mmetsp:Transcript_84445/g.217490  ORF Transcript_84445/g.217490 Transcript_84445/m.217490 type:complete len:458 (+) Transcript_84445:805-2178(+)
MSVAAHLLDSSDASGVPHNLVQALEEVCLELPGQARRVSADEAAGEQRRACGDHARAALLVRGGAHRRLGLGGRLGVDERHREVQGAEFEGLCGTSWTHHEQVDQGPQQPRSGALHGQATTSRRLALQLAQHGSWPSVLAALLPQCLDEGGKGLLLHCLCELRAEAHDVAKGPGRTAAESPVGRLQLAAQACDDDITKRRYPLPEGGVGLAGQANVAERADSELRRALRLQALEHALQRVVHAPLTALDERRSLLRLGVEAWRKDVLLSLQGGCVEEEPHVWVRVARGELRQSLRADGALRPLRDQLQHGVPPRILGEQRPDVPDRRRRERAVVIAATGQHMQDAQHARRHSLHEGICFPLLLLIPEGCVSCWLDVVAQRHNVTTAFLPEHAAALHILQRIVQLRGLLYLLHLELDLAGVLLLLCRQGRGAATRAEAHPLGGVTLQLRKQRGEVLLV